MGRGGRGEGRRKEEEEEEGREEVACAETLPA